MTGRRRQRSLVAPGELGQIYANLNFDIVGSRKAKRDKSKAKQFDGAEGR